MHVATIGQTCNAKSVGIAVPVLIGKAKGTTDDRLVRSEGREQAKVHDAKVVVGAMNDGATSNNFDAFDPIDRRHVVHRWVQPQREVNRLPILHDEQLARAPWW